jgi:rRNA processing protein Gar1
MTIQINDPKLVEQLLQAGQVVDLIGPDGTPFGQFSTFRHDLPPGVVDPFTKEQIEERRKDREGLTFEEMWKEIRSKERK